MNPSKSQKKSSGITSSIRNEGNPVLRDSISAILHWEEAGRRCGNQKSCLGADSRCLLVDFSAQRQCLCSCVHVYIRSVSAGVPRQFEDLNVAGQPA